MVQAPTSGAPSQRTPLRPTVGSRHRVRPTRHNRVVDRIISSLLARFAEGYGFSDLEQHKQFERFANYCVVATRGADETFDVEEITVDNAEMGIDGLAILVNGRIVTDPEEIEGLADQNGMSRPWACASR